jgi:peptidoglycan/xylan/chitin deacetylase (PgdA/CDA1 family)
MEELRGHTVVPLDEYDPDNRKHVVITFDGVYENVFGHAVPIMKKFGYPFELFIVGETIGQENRFDQPAEPPARFANIEQIESMVHEGGRLQWHSRSHKDLTKVEDSKSLDHELRVPDDLRKLDPKGFRWFAYPHGEVSSKLIERTKKFFRGGLSCVQGNGSDPYQLNRLMVDNDTKFQHSTVSLIIANYNYGRFAPEAIESALRQTVYPDEILFIDDGSTDNSIEIAGRYGDHIRIVRNKKNLGIIKTFNKAASLTKGDYICFLGADNRFRSDYV